jgi:hypothetical protein
MPDTLLEDAFSYDGWLVFNGLFETDIDGDEMPNELIEKFEEYEPPEPGENAEGYRRTNLDETLQTAGDLTWELHRLGEKLYSFEYKRTGWKTESGYKNGELASFQKEDSKSIKIYWDSDYGLMTFKGRKSWLSRNRKKLRGGLSEDVKLEELNFKHDFFLWVLYQNFIGQGLTSEMSIQRVSTLETTSDSIDNTGQDISIQDSKNVLRSVPAITAILNSKKPNALECKFVLDNQSVRAKIEQGGKVHVKVSDSEMADFSDLRRMGISLQFIFELMRQYNIWQRLGPKEKYPPEGFFYDLAERAEEEGYELTGELKRLPEEYKRKREGHEDGEGGVFGQSSS